VLAVKHLTAIVNLVLLSFLGELECSMELEHLRKLFKEQKAALIESYQAEGGGIGKDEQGYYFVLYTSNPALLASPTPHFWNGVRLVFKYVGEIKPQI
jgi:hypothetical protein